MRLSRIGLFLAGLALASVLSGCVTTVGQSVLADSGLGKDLVTILAQIRDNPLLQTIGQDSKATRAWAESQFGTTGKTPDPLKLRLASACPDAVDAVGGSITTTVNDLIAQVEAATAPPDPNQPKGFLMLQLTQLKYGESPDPKARIAELKKILRLQTDAVFTGCAHLAPRKQMQDLAILLVKAGVIGETGGAAAPFIGALGVLN